MKMICEASDRCQNSQNCFHFGLHDKGGGCNNACEMELGGGIVGSKCITEEEWNKRKDIENKAPMYLCNRIEECEISGSPYYRECKHKIPHEWDGGGICLLNCGKPCSHVAGQECVKIEIKTKEEEERQIEEDEKDKLIDILEAKIMELGRRITELEEDLGYTQSLLNQRTK